MDDPLNEDQAVMLWLLGADEGGCLDSHVPLWIAHRGVRAGLVNLTGGRWMFTAEVVVDGAPVAETMIAAGHARPYDGGRRQGWCD